MATYTGRLERWMRLVADAGLDGWLVADFRWNNPVFARLLGLDRGILTRRCFLWLPAWGRGEPRILASRIEEHTFSSVECPASFYSGFVEMQNLLTEMLPAGGTVAMEYVEHGALPTVSRVDAGMVELIRSGDVRVVSSGSLISALEVWDERQRALHERAARGVDETRRLALRHVADALRGGARLTEVAVADAITRSFADAGLAGPAGPDVAVDGHAADPHYSAGDGPGTEIGPDSVLLIDLWARVRDAEEAPCADSTWMTYTGASPPEELVRVFEAVRAARNRAIDAIDGAARAGRTVPGREVDRVARVALEAAGLGENLRHRTGHSLGTDHVHGMGTNLDDVEFPDDRPLLEWSGFTVEPGAYFPGRFGVRLEVSAILHPDGLQITTERQEELTLLG